MSAIADAPRFVLAPEVWLALALEAEAHGGIGKGALWDGVHREACPVCLYGLAGALDGVTHKQLSKATYDGTPAKTPMLRALQEAGITWDQSDDAVGAVRRRSSHPRPFRVEWEAFATELGLGIKGVDDVTRD